jgi:hypothetical protein
VSNYKDSFGQPKPPEQAIAARLTAIAEKVADRSENSYGFEWRDELTFLLAHVETLTQQVAGLEHAIADQSATFKKVEQQRDTAHAALRKYGEHHTYCTTMDCDYAPLHLWPLYCPSPRAGDGARPLMSNYRDDMGQPVRQPTMTDLEKAIQQLTAALTSESPTDTHDGTILAIARGVLVILLKLQQEGADS